MPATFQRDRELKWLPVDKIIPNERNPRSAPHFALEDLQGLIRSIQAHGILEPLIVQPYRQGQYLLIEGERRWTVAKHLGLKEVPATIVRKLEGDEQVTVMYNLHENRRGWEMADHLQAIRALMQSQPDADEAELAQELGISLATFRDRLRVMQMGEPVIKDIATGRVDYTSALRSAQAATAIAKKRPELAKEMGGQKKVEQALIRKAKARGGISHELTAGKQDLTDTDHVPDEVIREYLAKPDAGLRELRQAAPPRAAQRAAVKNLAKSVLKVEDDLKELADSDLSQAPNLLALRGALAALIEVASALEERVTTVLLEKQAVDQTETVKRRRRPGAPADSTDAEVQASLAAADAARREPENEGSHRG